MGRRLRGVIHPHNAEPVIDGIVREPSEIAAVRHDAIDLKIVCARVIHVAAEQNPVSKGSWLKRNAVGNAGAIVGQDWIRQRS